MPLRISGDEYGDEDEDENEDGGIRRWLVGWMIAGALAMFAGCLTVPANVRAAFEPSAGSHFAGGGHPVNESGGHAQPAAPVPPTVDAATPKVAVPDAAASADGGVP